MKPKIGDYVELKYLGSECIIKVTVVGRRVDFTEKSNYELKGKIISCKPAWYDSGELVGGFISYHSIRKLTIDEVRMEML